MSETEIREVIGKELNTKVIIQGSHGGGCINDAVTMTTDDGKKIFVKINKKSEVCRQYQVWITQVKIRSRMLKL